MLVVQGITNEGNRFRPSTWTDMLVGRYTNTFFTHNAFANLSSQETQTCIAISKHLTVCFNHEKGLQEVRVSDYVRCEHPAVYNHIKRFAIINDLTFTETELGGDFNEEEIV